MTPETPKFNAPTGEISYEHIGESLSQVMVSLLERRYLSDFKSNYWKIEPNSPADSQIFLREVIEIGRDHVPEEMFKAVPYILAACHDPGNAFVFSFFGSGTRQHIYLGGKRIPGRISNRNIRDYLSGVYSAYKSFNGGLLLSEPYSIKSNKYQSLHDFINEAKAFSVVTGIPSGRDGVFSLNYQGLDRLSRAAGSGQYAFMVVAEPVPAAELDAMLDTCRKLKSEIHSLIKTTRSYGRSTSKSVTTTQKEPQKEGFRQNAPKYLMGAALFMEAIQLLPGVRQLNGLIALLQTGGMQMLYQSRLNEAPPKSHTEGESLTETEGMEIFDAHAEAVEQVLNQHIARLQSARSNGWWNTAVYVAAASSETLNNVTGALKSICSGDKTYLDPVRELRISPSLVKEAMLNGQILSVRPLIKSNISHPLGPLFESLATCLNSDELSILAHLPVKEVPGLMMRGFSKFSMSAPATPEASIRIGDLYNGTEHKLSELRISLKSLNLHALITGMPGFGKTTTCMQIITEAFLQHGIPFLVIEPAKKEYRQLAQLESLRKKLRVYSIGIDSPMPLRINPFEFQEGVSLAKHIDLLKAVFNASFPMFAGMSYVLEDAILAIYQERGWNIFTSRNPFLREEDPEARFMLIPTLGDLLNKIEDVLAEKKYGQEIHQNLGAALRSRINSLTTGTKGMVLNSKRSSPLIELMTQPTVIELQDLGDDQEKAFIMALLLVNLYEFAELRQKDLPHDRREKLQHLTLVEEAHRLLSGAGHSGSEESGDPRGKAVSMFTDMLAEVRAYGEGLLIADQIPTKLAPEILKNTNLKIIHRLNAPDDRSLVGRSINLNDGQLNYLNNLPPLFAVIHDAMINEAVLAKVHPFKAKQFVHTTSADDEKYLRKLAENADLTYLRRHEGCTKCPRPCQFYHHQESARDIFDLLAIQRLRDSFYLQAFEQIKVSWAAAYTQLKLELAAMRYTDQTLNNGIIYCLLVSVFLEQEKARTGRAEVRKNFAAETIKLEKRMGTLGRMIHHLLFENGEPDADTLNLLKTELKANS